MILRRISSIIATLSLILGILACSVGSGAGSGVATSAATNPGGHSSAGGACANPLMPVVPGAIWFYQVSGSPAGDFTFSSSVLNISDNGFEEDSIYSTLTKDVTWQCTPAGLVTLLPGGGSSANIRTDNTNAEFETTGTDGVTLPVSVSTDDQWQQTIRVHGRHTNSDGSISTSDGTYVTAFTATRTQSIKVPAGVFTAMRIEWVTSINLTATVSGVPVPVHTGFSGVDWYAPGVGLVREVVDGDNGGTMELTSYAIP